MLLNRKLKPDERDLESRLLEGDREALAQLIDLYSKELRHLIRVKMDPRLRGRIDVGDVLQEVFIAAAQRLDRYRQAPPFSAFVWLKEIAFQRLIDLHRRHILAKKRTAKVETPMNTSAFRLSRQLFDRHATPSGVIASQEQLFQLEQILMAMQPIDRQVLAMRHFEGLSNDEVAKRLCITKAGASNRYARALIRMKKVISSHPDFQ